MASGGVIDRGEQGVYIAVVDAGDGITQADGCPVGEAGGEVEHPAFPGRARKSACVLGVDGGFPVDRRRAGAVVDEVAEVVAAGEPGG